MNDNAAKGGFWTKASSFQPKAKFRFYVTIDGLRLEDKRTKGAGGKIIQGGDAFADDEDDTNIVWYAKSIDKPGYQIADVYPEDYYAYGGNGDALKAPIPDKPRLKMPLKMTLIDPTYPNLTRKLLRWLRRTGYHDTEARDAMVLRQSGYEPAKELFQTIGKVRIYQLSPSINTGVEIDRITDPNVPGPDGVKIIYEKGAQILETWTLYQAYPARVDFGNLDYSSNDPVEVQIDWVYEHYTCKMESVMIEDNRELDYTYFKDFVPSEMEKPPTTRGSSKDCIARFKDFQSKTGKTKEEFLALTVNQDCKKSLGGNKENTEERQDSRDVAKGEADNPLDPNKKSN